MNPPYGTKIGDFIKKAYDEHIKNNITVVMLLPSRTDTKWFHDYILEKGEIEFIKGRLHFCTNGIPDKNGAPFPSIVVVYKKKERIEE